MTICRLFPDCLNYNSISWITTNSLPSPLISSKALQALGSLLWSTIRFIATTGWSFPNELQKSVPCEVGWLNQ